MDDRKIQPSSRRLKPHTSPPPTPSKSLLCRLTPVGRSALHGVHLDEMVPSSGVPPHGRLLWAGDGPVGGGLRLLRDHQPVPALSGDERARPDREGAQGEVMVMHEVRRSLWEAMARREMRGEGGGERKRDGSRDGGGG